MTLHTVLRSTLVGTVSGFMTRPCCVVPATMSLLGIGSARLGTSIAEHHALFPFMSAALLGFSVVVNFRRDGGRFNKALSVTASGVAFVVASGWLGRV